MEKLELRDEVRWFAEQMEKKLLENEHKSHWSLAKVGYLRRRLAQEASELRRAIESGAHPDQIDREAADIGNFCMMIARNYRDEFVEKEKQG